MSLSWSPPISIGDATLTGYQVYRGTSSTAIDTTPIATVNAATTTWTDTGVVTGTEYFYQVRATSTWGPSTASAAVSAVPGTAPAFSSANTSAFTYGTGSSFTVTASGDPAPAITLTSGILPAGLTLSGSTPGSVTITGTPSAGQVGTHSVTFSSANGVSPSASQVHTIVISAAAQSLSWTTTPNTGAVAGDTYAVGASSDAGLPVNVAVDAATSGYGTTTQACSISSSVVSFDHTGSCVLTATQRKRRLPSGRSDSAVHRRRHRGVNRDCRTARESGLRPSAANHYRHGRTGQRRSAHR